MPVKPVPYKVKCPKCGYSKIIKLSGDAFTSKDLFQMSTICPKCSNEMQRVTVNIFDILFRGKF